MKKKLNFLFFFTIIVFIYIILFEFILPVNKILPKPSLIIESFISIWKDYNLLIAIAETSTSIYIPLIFAYFIIIFVLKPWLFYFYKIYSLFNSVTFYKYIPIIFTIVIFNYWFNNSFIAELVYSFLLIMFLLKISAFENLKTIKEEYYITAQNLGLNEKEVFSKVVFKTIQPEMFNKIIDSHFLLWTFILFYEFIAKNGIGGVYEKLLTYKDFAGIFSLTLLISFLIFFVDYILRLIREKHFNWES